jgi:hypothetical protein
MWRMLWESELFTFAPDHPELHGVHPLRAGDEFVFSVCPHPRGPFIAVFTSDAAADWAGEQIPAPRPAIVAMPGEALFRLADNGEWWVRVNHGMSATVTLQPEAVASLVRGEYTHFRASEAVPQKMTLRHVPAEAVPAKLRQAIRVFCVQRPLAVAVYTFHPEDEVTGAVDEGELQVAVWLREEESDLFNDFGLMVEKVAPPHLRVRCAAVSPEDGAGNDFLQRCTPLWPVV